MKKEFKGLISLTYFDVGCIILSLRKFLKEQIMGVELWTSNSKHEVHATPLLTFYYSMMQTNIKIYPLQIFCNILI